MGWGAVGGAVDGRRLALALVGLHLGPLQRFLLLLKRVLLFEATPTPEIRSVVEHVVRVWIQRPVAALAGLLVVPGHFDEALVEG